MRRARPSSAVVAVVVAATVSCVRVPDQKTASMEQLGSQLTYLTASLRAAALDGSLDRPMPDREAVIVATRHDPQVARPFDSYVVRIARAGRHVIVIVCASDGQTALLEDASCTPGLDARRWEAAPQSPCEFSLVGRVCVAE